MKKIFIILIFVACPLSLFGQLISFPTPELRVDSIKPLEAYGITFPRPTTMINKLLIRGNRVPPTFYLQIVDSLGYSRFGITKNGMLISGTHSDPEVNIDGLFMQGRSNALKGADSFVAGKGVVNLADTAGAMGYYFTQSKNNSFTVGYGNNRIEMAADSGRFIGKWKLGSVSGISEAPQDGQTYGRNNKNWVVLSGSGGAESDPVWTADKANYYLKTNLQTSGQSQVHWDNVTNKPIIGTVTSVGMSMPNIFSITGSPVSGVGVLSATLTSQTQGAVFAAPTTGNGVPAFRALAETDIPALNWTKITSRPTTLAGYGITDAYTQTQLSTSGGSSIHWNNVANKVNAARNVAGLISLPPGTTSNRYLDETGAWTTPPTASGGITSVTTTNSATVVFSGDGTASTPLTATASISEADPTVPAQVKAITSTNIANWNTAFTNNHTHTNKTVLDGITATNVTNWNTAFGWGNHATAGYLSTETDPTVPAHVKSITTTNIASWNAPAWASITGKPVFATVATSGNYNDLSNKPTIPAEYTLPAATATTLGGIKVGSGLSVTADGTLSSSGGSSYTLPVATTAVLGGVVADANVSITVGGTMIPRKMVNTDVSLEAAADRLSIINTSGSSYTTGLDILADRITATVDGGSSYFTIPMQIYKTASEPDIPTNSFAFWVVSGTTFWLILDSNGTQKKIQLQ